MEHKALIDKLTQRVSHFEQMETSWNTKLEELTKEISQLKAQQQAMQKTQKEFSSENAPESSNNHPPKIPARENCLPGPFMELNSPIDALPMNPPYGTDVPVPLRSPVQHTMLSPVKCILIGSD